MSGHPFGSRVVRLLLARINTISMDAPKRTLGGVKLASNPFGRADPCAAASVATPRNYWPAFTARFLLSTLRARAVMTAL